MMKMHLVRTQRVLSFVPVRADIKEMAKHAQTLTNVQVKNSTTAIVRRLVATCWAALLVHVKKDTLVMASLVPI